jgi:ubiquinone/menaquinone biosynthesis C-methylase UbiE
MNLSEKIFGSQLEWLNTLFWIAFWRKEEILETIEHSQWVTGLRFSERGTLMKLLSEEFPIGSLLEAGCGVGQNLSLINKLMPSVPLTGVDLNPKSLLEAQNALTTSRASKIKLIEEDLTSLKQFPDKSFDIVIASAVLLYISADEIEKVISELLRVTSRKLFLLEQQQENPQFANQHLGVFVPRPGQFAGYWQRDYVKLISKFIRSENISVHDVLTPIWESEKWMQHAKVIITDVSTK